MSSYLKNVWAGFYTAVKGMMITSRHMFNKSVTIQYPDEKFDLPANARNKLVLDMSRCNACTACAIACPVNCITVEGVRVSPEDPHQEVHADGKPRKVWVTRYEMDLAKCCFCGLCQAACPSDAIKHTQDFEYSAYNKESLYFKYQILTPEQSAEKVRLLAEYKEKEAAAKAAAAEKAAAEGKPVAPKKAAPKADEASEQ